MNPKCSVGRYRNYGFYHPCDHPGKVEVDGKWYCGVHNPNRENKVRKAAESEARYEERLRIFRIKLAAPDLLAACKAALSNLTGVYETEADYFDLKTPGRLKILLTQAIKKAEGEQ